MSKRLRTLQITSFALLALFGTHCLANAAANGRPAAVPIPDSIVLDIALRTLEREEDQPAWKLDDRATEVRTFLSSMGGATWFGGYLSRFGKPQSIEEYKVSTLLGIRSSTLGHYYLHTQLLSPEVLTALSCNVPDPTNQTSRGFCALAHWDAMIALNVADAQEQFRKLAKQFLDDQRVGRWAWRIDIPQRQLEAPWISALTQSLGISVLLRAYQLTGDWAYLDGARAALQWLALPLDQGGVAVQVPGGVWYEEYPNSALPSRVLNGHIWALFGIWDFYRVTGDEEAKRMFDAGVSALEENIADYDLSGWSVYSHENKVDFVTGAYQQFIVEQLRVVEVISRSQVVKMYREVWECSLSHNGLFVHLAASEFSKARGLGSVEPGYPSYCARLKRN